MTRRIAAAILLTSWAVLLLGGAASYVSIRRVLLAELDDSLVLRASSLPEVLGVRPAAAATPDGSPAPAAALPPGDRYVIKNPLGQTLARPAATPPSTPPRTPRVLSKSFATLADGSRTRTVTLAYPTTAGTPPLTVIYSGSAARFDQLLARLAWVLLAIVAGSGAVVAGVAVGVARVALRPLRAAAGTLATIDDRTLDRRLDAASLPPEIRPVGLRMNQLLARLERGIGERKRFLADAAHELRTPVTALTTTIEVSLRRPRDAASLAATLRDCLSDARLLRRLVEMLLEQFRLDTTPAAAAAAVDTDVSALLDLCADAAATAARLRGVTVLRSYPPGVTFPTQPDRLRSIAGNLLSNGIEYNVPGGEVELTCQVTDAGLSLTVRDTGPGIPPAERARVFEPFYRPAAGAAAAAADTAAEPCGNGHAGLGLYLVRAHVQALGGTCRLDSPPSGGSEFHIDLPRPPSPRNGRVAAAPADTHELLTHAR